MPSITHQALASLFRESPALGLRLFQAVTDAALPAGAQARLHATQFTDLRPPEYAADAACVIEDRAGKVLGALIIEAQLSPDELKPHSWLSYTATLHRALLVPVTVLAVTLSEEMARWCARPHVYDHLGSSFRPLVIGPSVIPRITDVEQATALPELAVLSVAAHGQEPDAASIGIPAYLACGTLDTDRGARYADIIRAWLSDSARHALEEFLSMHGYEFQSEFAKKYAEEGRKGGLEEGHKEGRKEGHKEGRKEGRKEGQQELLIKLLGVKFGELPNGVVQRIRATDDEHLERWAERVLVARTLDDVFAD